MHAASQATDDCHRAERQRHGRHGRHTAHATCFTVDTTSSLQALLGCCSPYHKHPQINCACEQHRPLLGTLPARSQSTPTCAISKPNNKEGLATLWRQTHPPQTNTSRDLSHMSQTSPAINQSWSVRALFQQPTLCTMFNNPHVTHPCTEPILHPMSVHAQWPLWQLLRLGSAPRSLPLPASLSFASRRHLRPCATASCQQQPCQGTWRSAP